MSADNIFRDTLRRWLAARDIAKAEQAAYRDSDLTEQAEREGIIRGAKTDYRIRTIELADEARRWLQEGRR